MSNDLHHMRSVALITGNDETLLGKVQNDTKEDYDLVTFKQTITRLFGFVMMGFLQGFNFVCTFSKGSVLFVLSSHQRCLCRVAAVKCLPVHSITDVIFPILKQRQSIVDYQKLKVLIMS